MMADEREDSGSGSEGTEDNLKKLQEGFAQVESVQMKVKALSEEWLQTHQHLKAEEAKVTELEAHIDQLNLRHEEAKAALEADVARALARVKEKENVAEKLRAEVARLERKVEAACREAARSASEVEKGAHEARLALEATLAELTRQKHLSVLEKEEEEATEEEPPGEAAPLGQGGADPEEEEEEGRGAGASGEGALLRDPHAAATAGGPADVPPPQEVPKSA